MNTTSPRTRCHCGGVIFIDAGVCDSCGQDADTMPNRITTLLDNDDNAIPINVRRCQRCGYDHTTLFRPLTNPADGFTYWGTCAKTREPVLLAIVGDVGDATGIGVGNL